MIVTRLAKLVMVASLAVFAFVVTFDNITCAGKPQEPFATVRGRPARSIVPTTIPTKRSERDGRRLIN